MIRVTVPRPAAGDRLHRVVVRVGVGKATRARVLRGRKVRVDLRGRRRARVRVVIRVTTVRGDRRTLVRRYRTCTPRRG